MSAELEFLGIGIEHPQGRARQAGEPSRVYIQLATAGGRGREVTLTENDLVKLVAQGADKLAILKRVRT